MEIHKDSTTLVSVTGFLLRALRREIVQDYVAKDCSVHEEVNRWY